MDVIDLKAILTCLWNHPLNVLAFSSAIIATCLVSLIFRDRKTSSRLNPASVVKFPLDGREEEECEDEQEQLQDEESYSEEEIAQVPFKPVRFSPDDMVLKSNAFYEHIDQRRSCRQISSQAVPRQVIENIVKAAGTSPSGAHTQPWTYVIVADKIIKQKIQEIIEHEEYINYNRRMGDQWVNDLRPLKTNWSKPYLTEAPYIILLFRQVHGYWKDGRKRTHYYGEISTAISAGFLLLAIQESGLVTVTTTPMNCGPSLRQLLNRPSNEKLLLLFPVGLPPNDAKVPDIHRKKINKYMVYI